MSNLLVLDPSIKSAGVAIFRDGKLTEATTIKSKATGNILARVLSISEQIAMWTLINQVRPDVLVAEWPPVYAPGKETKGGPRAVVPLAGVCGAVAGLLSATTALRPLTMELECISYEPGDWIGRVPKDETVKGCKFSPRAVKILSRLAPEEIHVWNGIKYHDAIDAVGLGLHYLGRLGRRRVFAR